jgi:Gamma-glutamyl cyclotransferase, AIG2-like
MRLFLYGRLLDPDLLAMFAGRPVSLIPATLHGWRRVALLDRNYPTLRRARGSVEGAVAIVDRPTLARLTAYEGSAYRLTPVVVSVVGKGSRAALAWIAPGGTSRAWP